MSEEKNRPSCMARIFWIGLKLFLLLFFFLAIVGPGLMFGVFKSIEEQLPNVAYDSYRPDLSTKVFDCNDKMIAELHSEEKRSNLIKYDDLPKYLVQALVSIEDERFFTHYGIDIKSIFRAAYACAKASIAAGKFKKVQGASTLTQQLARNAFLTLEKSVARKLKEMVLATQIERRFTKQEILELYLNEIFFGHGIHGVHAAAQFYFGKSVTDLNIAESALLCGLIKSPEYYTPYRNPKISRDRQAVVLKKMFELGYIDQGTYETEKQRPIALRGRTEEKWIAPYFITHIRKTLLENYGARALYTGGLKVYTTLDMKMQQAAEDAVEASKVLKERPVAKYPSLNCALLAIDPRNGHIKAMVGGRDFERSKFNRATQAKRQPGSAFKPIVYATAIDYGIPPNRILNDEEVEFVNKWSGQIYKPQNYTKKYHGPVLLRVALEHSYNTVAVKLLTQIGIDRVISYAKKLGVKSRMGPNLSLALGSSVMTMLELAECYCVFANQGIKVPPYAIRRIVDVNGNVIYENNPPEKEIISPQTAYVITDIMTGVMKRGTGVSSRVDRPCAGKTGTTSDYRDAWFVGYTPQLLAAVYVGNDDFTPLGGKMAGGVVSGPIWKTFMEKALAGEPSLDFPRPRNVVNVTICSDSGLIATKYCTSRFSQAFIEGTEPVISCNLHELIELFDDDASLLGDAPFEGPGVSMFGENGASAGESENWEDGETGDPINFQAGEVSGPGKKGPAGAEGLTGMNVGSAAPNTRGAPEPADSQERYKNLMEVDERKSRREALIETLRKKIGHD